MTKRPTGAEKYFTGRMHDTAYRAEHAAATDRIRRTDAIVRALNEKREASGLSKAELARRADLPPEAVRRLFSAEGANPTLGTVTALANALNVELVLQPLAGNTT